MNFADVSNIDDNHWSIAPDQENTVGIVENNGNSILVKLNPTDRRGYRLIIQLWSKNPISTLNRRWTLNEMNSVTQVTNILSKMFFELNLFPQFFFAGNNAMEEVDNGILLGRKEPSMLHIHILGRGKPNYEYISGIPLNCPIIGQEFNLKGEGKDEDNTKKVPWTLEQKNTFREYVRAFLKKEEILK